MLACEVLGDSIGLGVGMQRPECMVVAKVGITSTAFLAKNGDHFLPADIAVISLGANDSDAAVTFANLRLLRAGITARQVYWLVPNSSPKIRWVIDTVAYENNDLIIDTAPFGAADDPVMHLHPNATGYREIADVAIPNRGCSIVYNQP
jgi:hypothetical protein